MKQAALPNSAQFLAVEHFQSLRDKHAPGSRQYEIADKAIDLALNHSRADDDFIERNAYRDARRTVDRRSKKREFLSIDAASDEAVYQLPDQYFYRIEDKASPESILLAKEALQQALPPNQGNPGNAERILQGMVDGESARETAQVLDISPSRIAQQRVAIKGRIEKYICEVVA